MYLRQKGVLLNTFIDIAKKDIILLQKLVQITQNMTLQCGMKSRMLLHVKKVSGLHQGQYRAKGCMLFGTIISGWVAVFMITFHEVECIIIYLYVCVT